MARIPAQELERLKRAVSLARLIERQGHKLMTQGNDLACRCPWHDDTASCIRRQVRVMARAPRAAGA